MNETLFYVFGLALVASALVVSAVGLRLEAFPPTRAVLAAIVVYFAGMVGATTTFAVLNAADEQHQREAEQAQEEAANASQGAATTATTTAAQAPSPAPEGATLKLAADPSAIAFDTDQLDGKAGKVTIDFDNPSPITHDVCIAGPDGKEIGCSPTITEDTTSLSENLKPGEYTFFCSVDGHEAAGMKGTLTIDQPARGQTTTEAAISGPGKELFTDSCGSCHTLANADTAGTTGPNLDQLQPDQAAVLAAIANGGTGSGIMPKGLYAGKQAQEVAQYVSSVAGK